MAMGYNRYARFFWCVVPPVLGNCIDFGSMMADDAESPAFLSCATARPSSCIPCAEGCAVSIDIDPAWDHDAAKPHRRSHRTASQQMHVDEAPRELADSLATFREQREVEMAAKQRGVFRLGMLAAGIGLLVYFGGSFVTAYVGEGPKFTGMLFVVLGSMIITTVKIDMDQELGKKSTTNPCLYHGFLVVVFLLNTFNTLAYGPMYVPVTLVALYGSLSKCFGGPYAANPSSVTGTLGMTALLGDSALYIMRGASLCCNIFMSSAGRWASLSVSGLCFLGSPPLAWWLWNREKEMTGNTTLGAYWMLWLWQIAGSVCFMLEQLVIDRSEPSRHWLNGAEGEHPSWLTGVVLSGVRVLGSIFWMSFRNQIFGFVSELFHAE